MSFENMPRHRLFGSNCRICKDISEQKPHHMCTHDTIGRSFTTIAPERHTSGDGAGKEANLMRRAFEVADATVRTRLAVYRRKARRYAVIHDTAVYCHCPTAGGCDVERSVFDQVSNEIRQAEEGRRPVEQPLFPADAPLMSATQTHLAGANKIVSLAPRRLLSRIGACPSGEHSPLRLATHHAARRFDGFNYPQEFQLASALTVRPAECWLRVPWTPTPLIEAATSVKAAPIAIAGTQKGSVVHPAATQRKFGAEIAVGAAFWYVEN